MQLPAGSSPEAVRAFNRARIEAAVRAAGSLSRPGIVAATGLSRATATTLVTQLLTDGVLVEADAAAEAERSAGRPPRLLSVAPRDDLVVAVDFGHSHCRTGVVAADGTVVAEQHARLDVDASAERAIAQASRSAARLLARLGRRRSHVVGGAVGLPAPVDVRTGSVGPGNMLPGWVGRRPADELSQELGVGFAIDNDANLGALAEARFGVARGVDDLVYVKASTGVGAGLVLGGRLHRGTAGRAGEIGHVPIDSAAHTAVVCRCGNRGCLETLASITQVLDALAPRHKRPVTPDDLVRLVDSGDAGAVRAVTDAGRLIGRVLADTVNGLNPQLIVLGGELAATGTPFVDGVRDSIDRYTQPAIAKDLRVRLGELGTHTQLLGAAALVLG